MRGQMQSVFKKEADGNIDQAAGRTAEGKQDDQDAQIEENALPHRGRQVGGSDGDTRHGGCGTVHRHCARSAPFGCGHQASDRSKEQSIVWPARATDRPIGLGLATRSPSAMTEISA